MSEDSSQEKSEEPTGKRLQDSKKKGEAARSKDLNSLMVLLFSSFAFVTLGPMLFNRFGCLIKDFLKFDKSILITPKATMNFALHFAIEIGSVIVPVLIIIMLGTLIGPLLIGGWNFSTEALMPKLSKLSPLKGFKKMFSLKSLMELVKSFLKFVVVATVGVIVWYNQFNDFLTIDQLPVEVAIAKGFKLLAWSFLFISSSLILIAMIDVPFQLYVHKNQLKMTKQEVKDEYKETEGKPEVKAHIRRLQMEVAQRRMMAEVPKADVILTNPTHYAVGISYDPEGLTSPRVMAKGCDLVAIHICNLGKEHEVPVMRLPSLTRAIYYSTELNQEIPRGLYVAVAQVLAYIFQLKNKDRLDKLEPLPEQLVNLPIPEDLKRD